MSAAAPTSTRAAGPVDPWLAVAPLCALAVLTAIQCWMYARVFTGDVSGNDSTHHLTEIKLIADAVRAGDFDWWNPAGNAGFPTGYYYQLLPAAVPGLLAAAFGSPLFWFQLAVFLSLVLVPAATYRGLRVMGAEPWPALGGALVSGFAMSGSRWGAGPEGVFWLGLYTQSVAMVGYPLALGHGWRWLTQGRGAAPAVLWGLFVGLSHPMAGVALGVALAVALPVALVIRFERGLPAARLVVLGALLLVGSASAWLQVLVDYDAFGGFPHRLPDEAGPGFAQLARWLRDGFLIDHRRELVDILTLLLVPSFVASAVLIALGHARHLAALWMSSLLFALILGAGPALRTGQDDLFPAVRVIGALQANLAMLIGAACVGGAVVAVRALDRVRLGWLGQGVIACGLGLAAIVTVVPAAATYHDRAQVMSDFDGMYRDELDQIMRAMRTAGPGRFQNRGEAKDGNPGVENHWFISLPFVHAGRGQLVTYGGAALQSSPSFFYLHGTPEPWRAAWIYDAPLVITTKERGPKIGGELLLATAHFELRELPAPGLISGVQVVGELPAGRKAARAAGVRWQGSPQPMNNQVLAHAGHGGAGPPPDGDVLDIGRGPSTIRARLVVRAPTTFLIRESWHPRWVATVDGRAARIRRVSPDMMAVDVGPGEHQLALSFERPSWQWALWLLVPLAGLLAWLSERWLGARRATPGRGAAATRA